MGFRWSRSKWIAPHRQYQASSSVHLEADEILQQKKYIVVTGGVISGIGKGVTASSIGVMLKMLNLRPTAIKIDPYLNVDAGTMSPFEHGEVFVLDDGSETDLDLGNYERFLDVKLTNDSNLTTGKIYQAVVGKERKGEYLGKTVQIIPHVTNEIMSRIVSVSKESVDDSQEEPDVCVIELGGTIGDIESMPFVEALRQLQLKVKRENFCLVHVSMVPIMGEEGEQKTKPTQHSVKELRALGLSPDFIVCRAKSVVHRSSREKISLFCNVPDDHVLSIHDVPNIYYVPLLMLEQNFHTLLVERLGLEEVVQQVSIAISTPAAPLCSVVLCCALLRSALVTLCLLKNSPIVCQPSSPPPIPAQSQSRSQVEVQGKAVAAPLNEPFVESWRSMVTKIDSAADDAVIALVGKYTNQQDSYLSVVSALKHACIGTDQRLRLVMVESSSLEETMKISDPAMYEEAWERLRSAHGILVPGGFGVRGIEGKVDAIRYARENNVPFLGVCLGMQAAVIEYARSKLHRPSANSREFLPAIADEDAAIVFMPEGAKETMGGTMRLGARRTLLQPGSRAAQLYGGADGVDERHRHRYEVNPGLVQALEEKGLLFSGKDETQQRMEVVELPASAHPYFVAVQFHPEFKSRPQRPAPVFLGLLQAVKDLREGKLPHTAAAPPAVTAVGTASTAAATKSSKV